MKALKYFPEAFCLILLSISVTTWVDSKQKTKILAQQTDVLTLLESTLPKHKVQLLNASFSDQVHYDSFAQLELVIESASMKLPNGHELKPLIETYSNTSLNYIQLVTMIKTSQRLVSESKAIDDAPSRFIEIRNLLFSFITAPELAIKNEISRLLKSETIEFNSDDQLKYWRLFKLHADFLLENVEATALYRQKLINLPILNDTLKSLHVQNIATNNNKEIKTVSLFSGVFAILMLLIIILKRQQRALEQSTKAYQYAAEVKTQFLANMSHEIRTPMTGIIGLVELCLKTDMREEQRNYLDKVEFSASSLLTIINDILDFSKIESGNLHIEHVVIAHDKLIDNLNIMLGRTTDDTNIELIFDLDPSIPTFIKGDPVRLNQVLLNVLSNALKFTDAGHVILRASVLLDPESEHNTQILYQIVDTGIGLSQAQINGLFKRFSQADNSTTRKYGGTGLGLAICKHLVDLMGGEIWVESQQGEGSTFNIKLPLIKEEGIDESPSCIKYAEKRLLLLEDNAITQEVIRRMADYFGVSIKVASTVSEANALCEESTFEIALIDWSLQGELGIDFINSVSNETYCPPTIYICSAYSKEFIKENSTVECHLNYIPKPLTLSSFEKLLCDASCIQVDQVSTTECVKLKEVNETPVQPAGDAQKVLLVEDNKINQIVATKMLESLSLQVDLAEDGHEAISMIKSGAYKVVLMDIQMPKMDGTEATIALRKIYTEEELKIIALTANITEEEVKYYKEIGMNGHLGKPYQLEKIKEALSEDFMFS